MQRTVSALVEVLCGDVLEDAFRDACRALVAVVDRVGEEVAVRVQQAVVDGP
jgi:hypothetical protein